MVELGILLFTVDASLARRAVVANLAGIVVDWEERRTTIGRALGAADRPDTRDDLARMAGIASLTVCRINPVGSDTPREVEAAVEAGATDLLVPMVESPGDVARVVALADRRLRVGIMIETAAGCDNARAIAGEPADFVYVGLLDLAISRREGNVFRALVDGTADRLREVFAGWPFGIGGVTCVDAGTPVPSRALIGELARLDASLTFARRSFIRDTAGRDLSVEHDRIQAAWREHRRRSPARVAADHHEFACRFGVSVPKVGGSA